MKSLGVAVLVLSSTMVPGLVSAEVICPETTVTPANGAFEGLGNDDVYWFVRVRGDPVVPPSTENSPADTISATWHGERRDSWNGDDGNCELIGYEALIFGTYDVTVALGGSYHCDFVYQASLSASGYDASSRGAGFGTYRGLVGDAGGGIWNTGCGIANAPAIELETTVVTSLGSFFFSEFFPEVLLNCEDGDCPLAETGFGFGYVGEFGLGAGLNFACGVVEAQNACNAL